MTEKLLILAVAFGIGYFLMNQFFKQRKQKDNGLNIDLNKKIYTLEELSPIWLIKDSPLIKEESTDAEIEFGRAQAPLFHNSITTEFWKEIIAENYKWFPKSEMHTSFDVAKAIKEVLNYIDKPEHASLSSVSGYKIKVGKEEKETDVECDLFEKEGTHAHYSKIKILPHTLGVAREIVPILKSSDARYKWETIIGPGILAALGHDLGKIHRQLNPTTTGSHEVLGKRIFEELCSGILSDKLIKEITHSISLHHTALTQDSPELLAKQIIRADIQQRKNELSIKIQDETDESKISFLDMVDVFKKEILSIIINPLENLHAVYYDKHSTASVVYIDKVKINEIGKSYNVQEQELVNVLKKLRTEKIITDINFNKYEHFVLKLKYNDIEEVVSIETIPIDYTMFALSQFDIHDKYQEIEMPKFIKTKA